MSSFSDKNVKAFIELLNNQWSLFCCQELKELEKEVALLPDNIEQLSKFISTWYLQRPIIQDAQFTILKSDVPQERLIPKNGKFSKPPTGSELNKKTLQNAIKRASDSISDKQ